MARPGPLTIVTRNRRRIEPSRPTPCRPQADDRQRTGPDHQCVHGRPIRGNAGNDSPRFRWHLPAAGTLPRRKTPVNRNPRCQVPCPRSRGHVRVPHPLRGWGTDDPRSERCPPGATPSSSRACLHCVVGMCQRAMHGPGIPDVAFNKPGIVHVPGESV